jgi:hypothetical protein
MVRTTISSLCVFIHDSGSSSVESKHRWMTNCKVFGRKWLWPIEILFRHLPGVTNENHDEHTHIYLLTELSPSWGAANWAANQELPSILWNPKVCVIPCSQEPSIGPYPEPYKSNPSHPISLRSILILSTHLRLGLPRGLFPSGFPWWAYERS